MLKFIRGKGHQPSADRQKLQKELFAFRKTAQHGFPHKPSALAYDSSLKLMAIGTSTGNIKVFGQPGVEFYGQILSPTGNQNECTVQILEWIPKTGRVLSLTTSNQLMLWEPAGALLVPVKSLNFEGKLKKVSAICASSNQNIVWIGTEAGNLYPFDLRSFSIKDQVIYHDNVLEQCPASYKHNPGAIESITEIANFSNRVLIVYNRGLCVLWDTTANTLIKAFIASGHGQSVGVYVHEANSEEFTWYHADGSYATWNIKTAESKSDPKYVPYGPDPCKSINYLVKGKRGRNDIMIFSGGMPRSAYGDHNCVSVHCTDGNKTCLDFTSKVIDFFVTFDGDDSDEAEVLVVLLEEEICAYDLTDSSLPPVKVPYLHSIHASAVTCTHLTSQVSQEVYEKILTASEVQNTEFSEIEWPVSGGELEDDEESDAMNEYEILLTGHEDGSVKFWDSTGVVLKPLLHFKTAVLFGLGDIDHHAEDSDSDDTQPPFRKAGLFDPYSDDPRLAIKRISFCPKTGRLMVAGTAGHIVLATFDKDNHLEMDAPLKFTTMNLVSDRDGFIWKGHDQLKVQEAFLDDDIKTVDISGVKITGVLQVLPPAAITCLAVQSEWNLVAAGTAHGLVLYDYLNHHQVYSRCTLNPNDLSGAGEQLSRRKSFKKTLRESFRRLRKGRSTRNNTLNNQTKIMDTRPVERQVEARPADDGMGSMVRCLLFASTYITNMHATIPTLWSGTNASCVSVVIIHLPIKPTQPEGEGQVRQATATLAKEIQLKHRAPIIGISILDQGGVPLDFNGPKTHPHRVLIASEEQFKVFSLPQLKPITKYKLTAHEGARVRKLGFGIFTCNVPRELVQHSPTKSRSEPSPQSDASNEDHEHVVQIHTEVNLMCLTNLGDCLVLSIPDLKRQLNAAAVRREDISGISSLCFTNYGEALCMMSSSEIQRITLSKSRICTPNGTIPLEPLNETDKVQEDNSTDTDEVSTVAQTLLERPTQNLLGIKEEQANGETTSPNKANETITSSIGDITIDSVRDHLNTTSSTICSTKSEEVGRISVLSTKVNSTITTIPGKDITDVGSLNDLGALIPGETIEKNSKSVIIKSVITNIQHGTTNGETTETTTTKVHKESQL